MFTLKMRRDWHFYALAIGFIFVLNGIVGVLGFETNGWKSYAVGIVTWVISFWLAALFIRRPRDGREGTADASD